MKAYGDLTDIERGRLQKFADEIFAEIDTDEFLRELGYDPEEVGKRMANVAREALIVAAEKAQAVDEESRKLTDECVVILEIGSRAILILEAVVGFPPEAQADEDLPIGSLNVLKMRLTDLRWLVTRLLTLALEAQERI